MPLLEFSGLGLLWEYTRPLLEPKWDLHFPPGGQLLSGSSLEPSRPGDSPVLVGKAGWSLWASRCPSSLHS